MVFLRVIEFVKKKNKNLELDEKKMLNFCYKDFFFLLLKLYIGRKFKIISYLLTCVKYLCNLWKISLKSCKKIFLII